MKNTWIRRIRIYLTTCIVMVLMTLAVGVVSHAAGAVFDDGTIVYQVLDEEAKTVQVGKGNINVYGASQTGLKKTAATAVVIPDEVTYNGKSYKVVKISPYAFYRCTSIRTVVIGENIKTIDIGAFKGCTSVMSIRWNAVSVEDFSYSNQSGSSNVFTDVGNNSQYGVTVSFGESVTRIPAYAFFTNTSANQYCKNIRYLFWGSNIESIGEYAFAYSSGITNLTLPNKLRQVPAHCFEQCTSLETVTISDSVESIGMAAFNGCTGIKSLELGNGLKTIGNNAFSGCVNVGELYWNVKDMGDLVAGNGIFSSLGQDTDGITVTFGADVSAIPANLFYPGDASIASKFVNVAVVKFDNLKVGSITIGENTFRECRNMSSIEIGSNVTAIGNNAFYGCVNVSEIIWDAVNTTDFDKGNGIFDNVGTSTDGVTVVIGGDVEKLPAYAFSPNLLSGGKNVNIKYLTVKAPAETLKLGDYAFYACENMIGVSFDGNNITIGNYTFANCKGLTDIPMYDCVTSIGDYAFSGCSGLGEAVLYDSLNSIGTGVFNGIGNTAEYPFVIYNMSSNAVTKGKHYNGSYVTVYGSFVVEYGESGDHGAYEANVDVTNYQGVDYIRGNQNMSLKVSADYTIQDPWSILSVEYNGEILTSVNNTYVVPVGSCQNVITISYRKRLEPFLAALNDVGYDTLEEAVKAAGNKDTVYICHEQTITSPITIDKSISIELYDNLGRTKVYNGAKASSMFNIPEGADVEISGDITFEGNSYTDVSTAYAMMSVKGSLTIGTGVVVEGQQVTGQTSYSNGGAIYNNGTFVLDGGIIRNNMAQYGGGVYCDDNSETYIENGSITDNIASYSGGTAVGGGIYSKSLITLASGKIIIDGNVAGTSDSNVFLKSTGIELADNVADGSRIGLTYAKTLSAQAGYITDKAVNEAWLDVIRSDSNSYEIGCNVDGLYVGRKVTFNGRINEDDAEAEILYKAVNPDTSCLDEMPEITRDGYVFREWYANNKQYTETTKIDSNITLYARWKEAVAQIGDTIYASFSDAIDAVDNGETIEILKDIKVSDSIVMDRNVAYTIHGNGFSIKRTSSKIMFNISSGDIVLEGIMLDGNSKSTSLVYVTGGKVSFTKDEDGNATYISRCVIGSPSDSNGHGAVYIAGGEAVLDGGVINDNSSSNGSGVYVKDGSFTVLSGEIRNNRSSVSGGAIYGADGDIIIEGGTISGNTCTGGNGAGIYVGAANITVSGSPVIKGNTVSSKDNNVYIANAGDTINVDNDISDDAYIGVTVSDAPTAFKNSDGIYEYNDRLIVDDTSFDIPEDAFVADTSGYLVVKENDEKIYVRRGLFSVVFNANGGTINNTENTIYIGEIEYGNTLESLYSSVTPVKTTGDDTIFSYWRNADNNEEYERITADTLIRKNTNLLAVWASHISPEPVIDLEDGTYYESKTVTISIDEGYDIYYTLDGKFPYNKSIRYTGPITIDDDVTLRAVGVRNGEDAYLYVDSGIVTRNYTMRIVNLVSIADNQKVMYKGESLQLNSDVVVGNDHTDKTVAWRIAGDTDGDNAPSEINVDGVNISAEGLLTVDEEANVDSVKVCAVSTVNSNVWDDINITIKKYVNVSYELGDWTTENITDNLKYKEEDKVVLKTPPDRVGFTFEGWSADNGDIYQPGDKYTVGNADVTFTALWEQDGIKSVTILVDDATIDQLDIVKGGSVLLKASVVAIGNVTKDVTWSIEGDCNEGTKVSNGLVTVASDETAASIKVKACSDYDNSVYAIVKINISGVPRNVSCYETVSLEKSIYNGKIEDGKGYALPEISRAGYTLDGWYILNDNTRYAQGDTITISGKDYVFYAKWIKNEISSISFIRKTGNINVGSTGNYEVSLTGTGTYTDDVIWVIEGNESENTIVEADETDSRKCVLKVAEDETAAQLKLKAISGFDTNVTAETTITVIGKASGVQVIGASDLRAGMTSRYEAKLLGEGIYDDGVVWSLDGFESSATYGVQGENDLSYYIMLGDDETADSITLTAYLSSTYGKDSEIKEEFVINIRGVISEITSITGEDEITKGGSSTYTADISGYGKYVDEIVWTLEGGSHEATRITAEGKTCTVTVGEGESAAEITLVVSDKEDHTLRIQKTIRVTEPSSEGGDQGDEEGGNQGDSESGDQGGTGSGGSGDQGRTGSSGSSGQGGTGSSGSSSQGGTGSGGNSDQGGTGNGGNSDQGGTGSGGSSSQGGTGNGGSGSQGGTGTDAGGNQTGTSAGDEQELLKAGTVITVGGSSYTVLSDDKNTVEFAKPVSNKKTSITIPATITYSGKKYTVVSMAKNCLKNNKKLKKVTIGSNVEKIGANALSGDAKCKSIVIKSSRLKSVGKNAFKGINKKAAIKVPKKMLSKYKKLLKKKGQKSTVKIKA